MRLKYYLRGLGIGIAVTALILAISGTDKAAAMTDEQIMARAKELGMQEVTEESAKEAAPKDKLPEKVNLPKEILPEKESADAAEAEKLQLDKAEETKEKQETDAATEEKKPAEVQDKQPKTETKEEKADVPGTDAKEPVKADAKEPSAGEKETQPKPETKEPVKTDEQKPDAPAETKPEGTQPEGEAAKQPIVITVNKGDSSVTVSRKAAEAGLVKAAAEYDAYLCQNGYDKKLAVGTHEIPAGATEEEIARILTTRKK